MSTDKSRPTSYEAAPYDIFIIGGGINGCGIARDAAGRGCSVRLVEQGDFASGTSSASSKLIHGGLRYLEHYEFRLVREALGERETLLRMAPHIIRPMRFILPHHKDLRPAWLLRLGLLLYDHIGKRKLLPGTKTVDLRKADVGAPLKDGFTKGFEYSDCFVNDARLVVLNAMDAASMGAEVLSRVRCIKAQRQGGLWQITTEDLASGVTSTCEAKVLINAAGPWVDRVLAQNLGQSNVQNVRLVKGSHIVVPKLYAHDRAYIFQNADGRIIFAIPYEDDFTLIGTTDQDYQGDPGQVGITTEERRYLCAAASEYFAAPVKETDIVWDYSGVRPLYDDGASKAQEATRDYVLNRTGDTGEAPMINIFGGKITTYRRLSEEVMTLLKPELPKASAAWTAGSMLPGGDFAALKFEDLWAKYQRDYPFLNPAHLRRLLRLYGSRTKILLAGMRCVDDLGQHFGADLYAVELTYLERHEWAITAEDVLFRRTKLALRMSDAEQQAVADYMGQRQRDPKGEAALTS